MLGILSLYDCKFSGTLKDKEMYCHPFGEIIFSYNPSGKGLTCAAQNYKSCSKAGINKSFYVTLHLHFIMINYDCKVH